MIIFWVTTDNPPQYMETEVDTIQFPYKDNWLMGYKDGKEIVFIPVELITSIRKGK